MASAETFFIVLNELRLPSLTIAHHPRALTRCTGDGRMRCLGRTTTPPRVG